MSGPVYRANPRVLCRELQGEMVLLDLDSGTYFGLDELGTEVWRRLTAGASLEEVVAALGELYDVGHAELERDLRALVDDLVARSLLLPT